MMSGLHRRRRTTGFGRLWIKRGGTAGANILLSLSDMRDVYRGDGSFFDLWDCPLSGPAICERKMIMIRPELDRVRDLAKGYDLVPVQTEIYADVVTPIICSARLQRAKNFFICWRASREERSGDAIRSSATILSCASPAAGRTSP